MASRFLSGFAGLVALLLVTACSAPESTAIVNASSDLPRQAEVAAVPFFPQQAYYCGPAALAMSLAWSGLAETPDSLAGQVYTPGRQGTLAADIVSAARRKGRLAVEIQGLDNLLAEVAAGHPVIVFQNLALDWWPQWHFAVVIGYDLTSREVVLHSGTTERLAIPLDVFERTWSRTDQWALLTLPPDRLPATADRRSVLLAAAGLEQAGRNDAAATAYDSITRRWPDDTAARVAQGNALLALGKFKSAEKAYRQAIAHDPGLAAAWNNLAYALIWQARDRAAITAAQAAVQNAGGETGIYRDTLREITQLTVASARLKPSGKPLVARTQLALNSTGFASGRVDGVLGPATRLAIQAYQSEHGLPVDGKPSARLLDHIRSGIAGV